MCVTSLHHPVPSQQQPIVVEVVLSGDLDMQRAAELERFLTAGLVRGCDIVVDLAGVRLIDCVCLSVLVRAARTAGMLDCALSLVEPSQLVRSTLRITEIDTLVPVFDDRSAALRWLAS
jgi:anti-anti-sigma factor